MQYQGLFGRSQRMERLRIGYAILSEKQFWKPSHSSSPRRSKRILVLQSQEDLKFAPSSCVLWALLQSNQPSLYLSYKLFDRWIHKCIAISLENWTCNGRNQTSSNDDTIMCYGEVTPRHFRLIEKVISYLIPQLKKLTIDITWNSALHNPKLHVPNLNAVTIHCTEQGVEFVCSDQTTAMLDLNVKDATLQLIYDQPSSSCHCLTVKGVNINDLSDAVSILEAGMQRDTGQRYLTPRKERFLLSTLRKLDDSVETPENIQGMQLILSSMSRQSSLRTRTSNPAAALWIQFGLVPRLLALLLDPTKNHANGLFYNIRKVCRALMLYEKQLASRAMILYICRALQQYGLQCRSVLVLLSHLMDDLTFRKIAIEQFDLAQTFARLLLVSNSSGKEGMISFDDNEGMLKEPQHIQVPPVYIINEQLRLPDIATMAWRVSPLPVRRNPPEQPLAQISILKNLLLLSPLNNHGVQFRSGHLTTLLLAFADRGIMEQFREKSDLHPLSGQELESSWFYVMRLVLANVHEHVYSHPIQASFSNVPRFHAYKPELEIKVLDSFVRQVLETMCKSQGQYPLMSTGFSLLTDLVTSTPTSVLSDLTVIHLKRYFLTIRLPPASTEVGSGFKMPVHLAAYDLLEAILTRTSPFPLDLLKQFVQVNLVGNVFQALELTFERQEMDRMNEEEGSLWTCKCWKLLTALASVCRCLQRKEPSQQQQQQVLMELEEQFVQEMIDPYQFHTTNVHHALANLKFIAVYLDSPLCLLYDRNDVFLKLLRWLRDALNRAWHQNETKWVVAALDVVTVVCGQVTDASISMVQSFLDGLLATLGWLEPLEGPKEIDDGSLTDRTVPLSSVALADWRASKPGPSEMRIVHYDNVEVTSDDQSSESDSHVSRSASMRKAEQQDPMIRSFSVDPRLISEPESPSKLMRFRSRQDGEIQEHGSAKSLQGLVIPLLNLGSLNSVRDWQQGRRSVASTVYSSEYPVRPLSQISDQSGAFSPPDILRQGTPMLNHESGIGANRTPPSDIDVMCSDLYNTSPSRSVHDEVPTLQLPSNTERFTYFHHCAMTHRSRQSIDMESSIETSSENSEGKRSLKQITITLEKRAHSSSAVDEMRTSMPHQKLRSPDAAFQKMHSFDRRSSRTSLAMRHLVGDFVSVVKETDSPSTDYLMTPSSLPDIVLFSQERPEENSRGSETGDDGSGTAVTVYAGSYSTDTREIELAWILNEKESIGLSDVTESDSMASLLSRFKLSTCDRILDNPAVHVAILKTFLRFLVADYSNKTRERSLTRMVAIGLHKHFHFVPKSILVMLKDWAIRHHLPQIYLLLKMMAKSLFDEQHYPSSRRIARGVFTSLHECRCPVTGGPSLCCVKVIDLPKDLYGMRSLRDLFMELAILQRIQSLPQAVRLYDVGTSEDNLYIIMKLYKMDLLTWRKQVTGGLKRGARMLFKIFAEILRSVDALHAAGIVHFDLKCSNILLDPLDEASNLYEWSEGSELPFRLILGDFGEAMFSERVSEGLQRSRGTQAFMSPEMLVSGSAGRRMVPGVPSDAWSLGCLFYELLTGELLFDDSDYSEFHTRLTTTSRTLVDPVKVNKIPEEMREAAWICLSYLLVRNPSMRAPLKAVAEWVDHLLATHVFPNTGRMFFATSEGKMRSSAHQHQSGVHEMSLFPQLYDLEIHRDHLPLSANVCLMHPAYAKDPWSLAEHHITHVVYVRLASSPKEDLLLIRNSTLRANGLLFEVLISEDEERSILSWTEHCQRCCQNVLLSCAASHFSHIAIVIGKDTGTFLQAIARFLTQEQEGLNLDASLFV